MPSHEKNAYLTKPDNSFKKEIITQLNHDDSSVLMIDGKIIRGNWTMIYNEGFDILAEDYSFFTFSKYTPDKINLGKKSWKSMCYSTLVGFYHKGKNLWGCFYAEKVGEDPNKITNDDLKDKLWVVEGTVKKISKMKLKEVNNVFDDLNFLQSKEKETLVLDAKFKDHSKVVEKINKMNGLWTAKSYDEYTNLSIEELNSLAGKRRHNHRSIFGEKKRNKRSSSSSQRTKSVFDMNNFNTLKNIKERYYYLLLLRDVDYPEFPKNYLDNVKHMPSPKNQVIYLNI